MPREKERPIEKTPKQLELITAQIRQRVEKLIMEDMEEIAEELKQSEFDGDHHMGAVEVLASVCATVSNHLETTVFKRGGQIIQTKA